VGRRRRPGRCLVDCGGGEGREAGEQGDAADKGKEDAARRGAATLEFHRVDPSDIANLDIIATGGDVPRICDLFGLSVNAAPTWPKVIPGVRELRRGRILFTTYDPRSSRRLTLS